MSMLAVAGLGHTYGSVDAVSDVSFAIEPGELVCIVGPSGCGKSTLLRCVAGLARPDQAGPRHLLSGGVVSTTVPSHSTTRHHLL